MSESTAFSELTPRQKRVVALFTDESKKNTYLNRIASYESCYSTKQSRKSRETACYRLFKKPSIVAAIKECLPPLAYDAMFVSNEYMEHYKNAKNEDDRKDCLDILKEMSKHTGMMDKKKDTVADANKSGKFEKHVKKAQDLWNEQMGIGSAIQSKAE